MKILRRFTVEGTPVEEQIKWKRMDALIINTVTGEIIFEHRDVEVPEDWSQTAVNMLAQKYFRKRGVPASIIINPEEPFLDGVPMWLRPRTSAPGCSTEGETSAKQVFHRLAGCWTYWAWVEGLMTDEESARKYYGEMYWMLAMQYGAP